MSRKIVSLVFFLVVASLAASSVVPAWAQSPEERCDPNGPFKICHYGEPQPPHADVTWDETQRHVFADEAVGPIIQQQVIREQVSNKRINRRVDARLKPALEKLRAELRAEIAKNRQPTEEATRRAVIEALMRYGAVTRADLDRMMPQIRDIVREEIRTALREAGFPVSPVTPAPTQPTTVPAATPTIVAIKFNDLDGDGLRDIGEGVMVATRFTLSGPVIREGRTDIDGRIEWRDLPLGTYTVTEDVPGGFVTTTGISRTITLTANQRHDLVFGNTARSVVPTPTVQTLEQRLQRKFLGLPLWAWVLIIAFAFLVIMGVFGVLAVPNWLTIVLALIVVLVILYGR